MSTIELQKLVIASVALDLSSRAGDHRQGGRTEVAEHLEAQARVLMDARTTLEHVGAMQGSIAALLAIPVSDTLGE